MVRHEAREQAFLMLCEYGFDCTRSAEEIYETAKAAGTVDVPGAMTDADVPEQFRAIRQELRGQSKE